MSTLGSLRTTVLARLGESTTSPVFWTTTEVDAALNKALNVMLSDTRLVLNKVSVTRNGSYFTVPSTCNGVDAIMYAGKNVQMTKPYQMPEITGTSSWATDTGTAVEWAVFNMEQSLLSPSNASVTFKLLPVLTTYTSADIYYVPYFTLVSDSTVPTPNLADEALAYYAMGELLIKTGVEEDANRSQMYMQKYAEIAARFTFDNFTKRVVTNSGGGRT